MKNYKQGLTNMATTEQEFKEDEIGIKFPALVLCMTPSMKQLVFEKYNISSRFFMMQAGEFEHLIGKKTMQEVILESSFRLNDDFQIIINRYPPMIYGDGGDVNLNLNIGANIFKMNGNEHFVNITEVYSLQQGGLCYILTSNLNLSVTNSYMLSIIPNEGNSNQKIKQVNVVSDTDGIGILMSLWQTKSLNVPDINTRSTIIDLREKTSTKISNCNENGESIYKCLATQIDQIIQSSNCSMKCRPMLVKSYFDSYMNSTTSDCHNLKDEKCTFDEVLGKFASIVPKCKRQCSTIGYFGEISRTNQAIIDFPNVKGQLFDLILVATYRSRTFYQEYKIYDEVGLIGSVGGSLGLFLGFSFYGLLSDVLDHF